MFTQPALSGHAEPPPPKASFATADPPSVTAAPEFNDFHRRHRDRIGAALALSLGDHALGFEAADEAMARALLRWDQVGRYTNPEGWVYRVGYNWATSFLRRRIMGWSRERRAGGDGWIETNMPDTDLAAAVDRLADGHRKVVVLRYFCDWSVEQAAAALDVSPGTVKSRLSRALDQLRRDLALRDVDDEVGGPHSHHHHSHHPNEHPNEHPEGSERR
ncbi:MAG: RNA polymerase sigma factor [Acidimicrobiia bacterium]|nr:RNA polymerase sigma factor [Acidimicrobiia bacterium]